MEGRLKNASATEVTYQILQHKLFVSHCLKFGAICSRSAFLNMAQVLAAFDAQNSYVHLNGMISDHHSSWLSISYLTLKMQ
jgi:hypothetical protein